MRKYPTHVTSAQGTTQNTLYITWGRKHTTVTTQIDLQNYYNEKCNLLYVLKGMELFELYSKGKAISFA